MVTVKNMTTKVNTKEKELGEIIQRDTRKSNLEISNAVYEEIQKLQKDTYQKRMINRLWILNVALGDKPELAVEHLDIVGKHTLENTDMEFFKKFAKVLREEIIESLRGYQIETVSYVGIGNMILALETVYPKFTHKKLNFGIPGIKSEKVKEVCKILQKMYVDIVNEKISQKEFIRNLEEMEKEGE